MVENRLSLSLCLVLNLAAAAFSSLEFSRFDFPTGFIFRAATSAYQVCLCCFFQIERLKKNRIEGLNLEEE